MAIIQLSQAKNILPINKFMKSIEDFGKIEETFKIMKSELNTRPLFVSLAEHIEGHFLICFTALVIIRVLEHLTEHRFSVKQIRKSLNSYSCSLFRFKILSL